jgi:two-component system response regulator NreC
MIRLVLGDDHTVVRQGLRALLAAEPGLEVAGDAADGEEILRLVAEHRPDVLLLDWMMPGLTGLEITKRVRRECPGTRVLILSMHANEAYVVEALRHGAAGYALKDTSATELLKAVRDVAAGVRYLSPPWTPEALTRYEERAAASAKDPGDTLTAREREILVLAAEGFTSPQIGLKLHISHRTVETHRARLMRKLELRSQSDLVRYAVRRGLLTDENT